MLLLHDLHYFAENCYFKEVPLFSTACDDKGSVTKVGLIIFSRNKLYSSISLFLILKKVSFLNTAYFLPKTYFFKREQHHLDRSSIDLCRTQK